MIVREMLEELCVQFDPALPARNASIIVGHLV